MPSLPRSPRVRWAIALTATLVVGVAGGGIATAIARSGGSSSWASTSLRTQLGLVEVQTRPAPAILLVDQQGRHVSLASLRGKAVVLDFMDPKCTDICPIVSQEYLRAAKLLGAKLGKVEFLAVNVNQYHERVADVAAFSRVHRLSTLPNWHFLTGSTAQLKRIWDAYGVSVVPNKDGDVVHSSVMYFIDPSGRLRWAAMPTNDKATIPTWGRGIATVAGHLA